jgi:hypothetical protein
MGTAWTWHAMCEPAFKDQAASFCRVKQSSGIHWIVVSVGPSTIPSGMVQRIFRDNPIINHFTEYCDR